MLLLLVLLVLLLMVAVQKGIRMTVAKAALLTTIEILGTTWWCKECRAETKCIRPFLKKQYPLFQIMKVFRKRFEFLISNLLYPPRCV
jgi:hypothetical protein